ncbi:hypothetical protein ACFYOV_06425 [Streptomyces sp. NPDC005931]|uniref:hypothetical protein n=1 Tax=Streptomyces sp. NPDC005931 TaxID=3364737 RepID=UPI0036B99136
MLERTRFTARCARGVAAAVVAVATLVLAANAAPAKAADPGPARSSTEPVEAAAP